MKANVLTLYLSSITPKIFKYMVDCVYYHFNLKLFNSNYFK